MKTKISTFSILLIAFALIFNSCKKEDAEKAAEQILPTKMKAKIDGVDWNAKSVYPIKLITATNNFTFTGTSVSGDIITMTTFGKEAKEYKLISAVGQTTVQFSAAYTLATAITDAFVMLDGSITLTKVDETNKLISGTFNFKGKNKLLVEKVITEGSFTDLKYTESSSK